MSLTIDGSTALSVGLVEHTTIVSNDKIDSISIKSHDQNMAIKWDASGRLSDMKVMSRGLGVQPVHINFNGEQGVEVTVGDTPAKPEIAKKALETASSLTRHLAYHSLLSHHLGVETATTALSQANEALKTALATPMAAARSDFHSLRSHIADTTHAQHDTKAAVTATASVTPKSSLKRMPTFGA